MILTCESCSTQFSVSAEVLGAAGRRVKCSRCGHGWFQKPEGEAPPAPEAIPDSPPPLNEQRLDEPRPRARPPVVVAPAPKRASGKMRLAAVGMLMIGSVMQAVMLLHYMNVGGKLLAGLGLHDTSAYQFAPLTFEAIPTAADKFTLALSGGVKNISDKEVAPLPVIITLYDMHGRTVSELPYPFNETPTLGSASVLPFQPKITNIPNSITKVTLELGNSLERSLR